MTPYSQPPDLPDLAIYSQEEQVALGATPTWASPDIEFRPGERDVKVTVRNLSATASAVNGIVELYSSTFGIGVRRNLDLTQRVSLAPNAQMTLTFRASTVVVGPPKNPALQAGAFVRLIHPHDGRPINNNGAGMRADAHTRTDGRTYRLLIPVVNQALAPEDISLSFLPNELNATTIPSSQVLAPMEQIFATIDMQVPDALHGTKTSPFRREATLLGRGADGGLIDGLTFVVWIDD